jgi:hypothetical protein
VAASTNIYDQFGPAQLPASASSAPVQSAPAPATHGTPPANNTSNGGIPADAPIMQPAGASGNIYDQFGEATPPPPPAGASQQQLNEYNKAAIDQGRPQDYTPPSIDNARRPITDGLIGIAKGLGLGGQAIIDFATDGVQAIAAAHDKIAAARQGTTTDEMRREGTSMEQAVEQSRAATAPRQAELQPSNTEQRIFSFGGQTALFLAEAIATPAGDLAQGGRAAQAAAGAIKMQGPAVMHGVEVGREVFRQTDDALAALKAGLAAWSSMTAMGVVPGAVGANRAMAAVTGAGIGVGMGEAQRRIENAALPPGMQQPFDPLQAGLVGAQGAVMGGVVGGHSSPAARPGAEAVPATNAAPADPLTALNARQDNAQVGSSGRDKAAVLGDSMALSREYATQDEAALQSSHRQVVEAGPANVIEAGQQHVEAAVAAQGGDALDQKVAAIQVTAHLGAHFDAAAVQGAREAEQGALTARRAAEAEAAQQQSVQDQMRAQARGTPDDFRELPPETPAAPEAKSADDSNLPTLTEPISPEQQQAFRTLADRRKAEMAVRQTAPTEWVDEPTAPAEAKASETAAPEAPAPVNRLAAIRAAAEKRQAVRAVEPVKAAEPVEKAAAESEEEEQPETNPAPATQKTLAERRQAALDTKMAEKVRVAPAPDAAARQRTAEALGDLLGRAGKRMAMESHGQGILDDLADAGHTSNDVAQKFWNDTYYKLPAPVQARFRGMLEEHSGLTKGSATDVAATVRDRMDLPDNPEHLEGTDRGFVALMDEANRRVDAGAPASATAPAGRPMLAGKTAGARPTLSLRRAAAGADGEAASPESQRIRDQFAREAAFQQDADYKNLMTARPKDVENLVARMSPGEAQTHLERLDAAPGDNPVARAALEARAAVPTEETSPQRPLFADAARAQPAARPEDVQHTVKPDGTHIAETPSGKTTAVERPDGNLQVKSSETGRGLRGAGEGTARLERLAQEAHDRGGNLESDTRVSAPAQRVYSQLAERGYPVEERPNETDPGTGEKISASAQRGVYSVGPRDLSTLNGLQLRRLANTGDTAARAEIDRRVNGGANTPAAQPPEAEQGALAARRTASRLGEPPGPRLTKAEGEAAIKPMTDRLGTSVNVHESKDADTVPQNIKDAMRPGSKNENAPGAYDPATGTAHLFANAHTSHEQFMRTAAHEITGHLGLRRLLGDDFSKTMDNIARNADAEGKAWMKEYASEKGLNPRAPESKRVMADEWAAHLAEFNEDSPGTWQKIVDAVREGLRRVGLVREWRETDIKALVRKSETNLRGIDPRVKTLQDAQGLRFANADDSEHYERFPPDHPLAVGAKLGKGAADQENYSKGTIRSLADWGRTQEEQLQGYKESAPEKAKEAAGELLHKSLGMAFLHNLPDFLNERTRPLMPSAQRFIDTHDALDATRGRTAEPGAKLGEEWRKYNSEQADGGEKLFDLMHDSTLDRVDPSTKYKPMFDEKRVARDPKAEARRRTRHQELQDTYASLDDKGRELYNAVRKHYGDMRANEVSAFEDRVNASGASSATKEKYLAVLRRQFDSSAKIEPYFPLARPEGEHWASAKDSDGNTVAYSRFDSSNKKNAWKAQAEQRGLEVKDGRNMDTPAERRKLDPQFASEVADMARDISPEFSEDVWQHFLRSMPETGAIKKGLPRQGRLGYTQDALHNFKNAVQRNALTVSRLQHGQKLADLSDQIKGEARTIEQSPNTTKQDKLYANALAKEFAQRNDMITNPKAAGPLASMIMKGGFAKYLWWSPGTMYRILMQNPLLAQPELAKHFGGLKATAELSRASAQWVTARGTDRLIDTLRDGKKLAFAGKAAPGERQALEDALHMGLIKSTWAKTLVSGGPRPPGETAPAEGIAGAPGRVKSGFDAILKSGSLLFDTAEQHNRVTTMLAAFRLGIDKGMSHDDAAQLARTIVRNAHVDYSLAGRPRYTQTSDAARVVSQFKLYGGAVAYRLFREARNALRMDGGVTPQQRWQSTKALSNILGRAALLGGTRSMPLYWITAAVVNAYMHNVEGDKDYDMTNELKQGLTSTLGKKGATAVMHGPLSELSGYSLGSAADYDNLFYHSDDEDKSAAATFSDGLEQLVGASAGAGSSVAQALDTATGPNGNIERGLEHAMPASISNLLMAWRYHTEGALNARGEPIIPREAVGNQQAFFRAIGFNPTDLVDQYETNTGYNNAKQRIMNEKAGLENAMSRAANNGDQAAMDKVLAKIEKHNEANADNPEAIVTPKGLGESVRSKARAAATSVGGQSVKGYQGLAGKFGLEQQQ